MVYEYEDAVIDVLESIENEYKLDYGNEIKEVREAYRKANAWDKYLLSVEEDARNEFGNKEALIKHAVELNKKIFMEDE